MFSIFANNLNKKELPTVEVLLDELKNTVIGGVNPIVREMEFTTNFTKAVTPYLLKLDGHSKFFQFKFVRDHNGDARLYLKEDELDPDTVFPRAVKLLKSVPDFADLSVTEFREETEYSRIFSSVWSKYIPTLESKYPEEYIDKVKSDWEKRIQFLIDIKQSDYTAFDLGVLRKQTTLCRQGELIQMASTRDRDTQITATFYPTEAASFSVQDIKNGDNLIFYTVAKSSRPWVGLCLEVVMEHDSVYVKTQWLKRERNLFVPWLLSDGSPYISQVECECIMFHNVLVNTSESERGPFSWPSNDIRRDVMSAYLERDNAFEIS